MQTYLEKFGVNFIVAAFVPSLAFTLLTSLLFSSLLDFQQHPWLSKLLTTWSVYESTLPLSLAITIIIGFTLSSLNTYTYKLFEGYFLLQKFHCLLTRQRKHVRKLHLQLRKTEARIAYLEEQLNLPPMKSVQKTGNQISGRSQLSHQLERLMNIRHQLASTLDRNYPPSMQHVLPTRFGNILRAAEFYSATRYKIDAVLMWPRLIHAIPASYYAKIEESNNQLAFLVNCSILSMAYTLLSLGATAHTFINMNLEKLSVYASVAGLSILSVWLFYQATLTIIMRHGDLIRSAYDLFRFDLLRQYRISPPKDLAEEQMQWNTLSEFVTLGERYGPIELEYEHPPERGQTQASSGK